MTASNFEAGSYMHNIFNLHDFLWQWRQQNLCILWNCDYSFVMYAFKRFSAASKLRLDLKITPYLIMQISDCYSTTFASTQVPNEHVIWTICRTLSKLYYSSKYLSFELVNKPIIESNQLWPTYFLNILWKQIYEVKVSNKTV